VTKIIPNRTTRRNYPGKYDFLSQYSDANKYIVPLAG
jgi:hypothetical protein